MKSLDSILATVFVGLYCVVPGFKVYLQYSHLGATLIP